MNSQYKNTVALLIKVAPIVFETPGFALKGGTAINLFMTDMPRLSVDLDVVLTDHRLDRAEALELIEQFISNAEKNISKRFGLKVIRNTSSSGDVAFTVKSPEDIVKIEVNPVMRGTLKDIVRYSITQPVEDLFKASLTLPLLDKNELYGSKFVAALDRQHPRDLFDVHELYSQGNGITAEMIECFVAYLAVSPRPIDEVLYPNIKDIQYEYEHHFVGMTNDEVPLEHLLQAREQLARDIQSRLSSNHKAFLMSLAAGDPDYSLIDIPHLADMPAMRWKVENLQRFARENPSEMEKQARKLEEKLGQANPFNI